MTTGVELEAYLANWAGNGKDRSALAATVAAIARTAIAVSDLVGQGALAGRMSEIVSENVDRDAQQALDVHANDMFLEALKGVPVAAVGSEEADDPIVLDQTAPLAVAIDPLDGSSNIETNVSIGTIFGVLPYITGDPKATFARPGTDLIAAGFAIYGPQTALVLSVGEGTHIFTLDRANARFILTRENVRIPDGHREFAINVSNYRHWNAAIRDYIDDCLAGADGPRGANFNMRWIASLVAEVYRILVRGGIFLYPRDARPDYREGRLRLVYEANPIAFLVEQAGGGATDGENRILDLKPATLHGHTPLVFGAADKVARVAAYHQAPQKAAAQSPLFGKRGLFRD